jgi:CubicO group peptidase (beta-lactamase class C family)
MYFKKFIIGVIVIILISITTVSFVRLRHWNKCPEYATEVSRYSCQNYGNGLIVYDMNLKSVIIEDYYRDFSSDQNHMLWSGTKSFAGVLLAYLVQVGLIDSFDISIASVITEWQGMSGYGDITFRQLLNLSSGLESGNYRSSYQDVSQTLQVELTPIPGEIFSYGPHPFQIFSEAVSRITGLSAEVYLEDNILSPLGIEVASWEFTKDEVAMLTHGAEMRLDEWLEFGIFLYDSVVLEKDILIQPDILKELIEPSEANPDYGITFWLGPDPDIITPNSLNIFDIFRRDSNKELEFDFFMAAGARGQRLYIVPDKGLIVARFALRQGAFSDAEFLSLL